MRRGGQRNTDSGRSDRNAVNSAESSGMLLNGIKDGGQSECYPEVSRTLSARHDSSPCVDRGQEFICYAKTSKPRSADEAPTIVESDIAPTLGTHDVSEARQNQYVVFPGDDTFQCLTANNAGGAAENA